MPVRIGIDVGGTFTKAVACDSISGDAVARSVVPTTHASSSGVADGIVTALGEIADEVLSRDLGPIELVAHSTTQAVNALLEGDTATVGVLGMARRPDLRRGRKRTAVGDVRLAPGRRLSTRHAFVDVTGGVDRAPLRATIHELVEGGVDALCVSEAFSVDDARGEWMALEIADEMGLPVCAGHELTGLYGLEMRTVTAAINASILPAALRTASYVERAVGESAAGAPLLVMRGDGGAVALRAMKRHPLLTAFSGPAASVAGALHHGLIQDGVVVEVGGTSTNISAIQRGRPVLSYVRVLDHVTCVRSLDVRVVGVAGGSLLRVGTRRGRSRLIEVGPRSAHIAGLAYSCFVSPDELATATTRLIAPRPGDPEGYLVLETGSGRRVAPTVTCAANALGEVPQGSYARGNREAATRAFDIAGEALGVPGRVLARSVLAAAADKLAVAVAGTCAERKLASPAIVGVGGGAGALIPALGTALGARWEIPPDAEVISSIGDALSLVRVEVERTLARPSADAVARLHREVEEAALSAGAAPGTIQVESETVPERGALRVTAFGSVALEAASDASLPATDRGAEAARQRLGDSAELVARTEFFSVYTHGPAGERGFSVIDRRGAVALDARGTILTGTGSEVAARLAERIPALARHYGPVAVAPALRLVRGPRLIDLTLISDPDAAREAALAECALAHDDEVVALISRD